MGLALAEANKRGLSLGRRCPEPTDECAMPGDQGHISNFLDQTWFHDYETRLI